jgi:NADH-quinone oxidoreductase subunit G
VALGEEFGLPAGTPITGKMVTALKRLGFKQVFDTDFAADLTIMEEATEFVNRVKSGGKLPILTSCCPSWVNFMEQQFPDMLDIPSSCKSPHEMFGALTKSYYCEKTGLKPEDVVVVSIMPCVAKKYESRRAELEGADGHRDVDYVITTRELAIMIKETGINFLDLHDSDFDNPMGESTGAGVIFGASGGVIEATLRTAYHMITGDELADTQMEFQSLRGLKGIKTASVTIMDRVFNIAVAHGLGNARKLLEGIKSGEYEVDAIEIMACPGGCIGGAGQPYHHGNMEILEQRIAGIYSEDRSKHKRRSHQNEYVQLLYRDFLGEPGSEKAIDLLHTHYTPRPRL